MSVSPRILVLGTHNRKKGLEMAQLLAPFGLTIRTLADFSQAIEVEEDGDSFDANATLKAVQQARHLGHWVLGEDSGLCVDALDGQPGIYSARYSGPAATDDSNIAQLLEQLADLPLQRRTARYVSHMTLADQTGCIRAEAHGTCHGRIAPRGAARRASATIRSLRSSNTTARLANSARS